MDEPVQIQFEAVNQRFIDQEKQFLSILNEHEKAIGKAQVAMESRFTNVNEFRAQLGDQQRTFIPRVEYDRAHSALLDKFDSETKELRSQQERMRDELRSQADRQRGMGSMWAFVVGGIGLLSMLIQIFWRR